MWPHRYKRGWETSFVLRDSGPGEKPIHVGEGKADVRAQPGSIARISKHVIPKFGMGNILVTLFSLKQYSRDSK